MDFGLASYGIVAACAFVAQVLGGIAGYGTGLLMPLVLVPLVGAEATVPVIALSALLTNPARLLTFRAHLDRRAALTVIALAFPTVLLGAFGFALLSGRVAQIVIGAMLIVLAPAGRILRHRRARLSDAQFGVSAVIFGLIMGGTSGSGVILLSILMARGMGGMATIATDAAVSTVLGVAKVGVFAGAGVLPPGLWLLALTIGAMAVPGARFGKYLIGRFPVTVHTTLLDAAIFVAGVVMVGAALSQAP